MLNYKSLATKIKSFIINNNKEDIMNNSINTTVHTGTFTKADGSQRTMRFVRFSDIPSSYRGDKTPRSNGSIETVYDVDAQGYRTFNNSTVVGSLTSIKEVVTFG
jgi:hypothetical protein